MFLLYLGVQTLRARPPDPDPAAPAAALGLRAAFLSTLLLTLTNPVTILSFTAVFAGAGVADVERASAWLIVLGVFLGSLVWWLLLTTGVSLLRERFNSTMMLWVNRLSGAIIIVFACVLLLT